LPEVRGGLGGLAMIHQAATLGQEARKMMERRRFQRVSVSILGRYMLANRQEYPCQTIDMSPGGASLMAPVKGALGERVIVYLEQIGRIEGEVTRHMPQGFALNINAAPIKRDKIASQLTWLANRQALGLPEDRRHERITPINAGIILRFESGRELAARLIDISMSGAAVATDSRPSVGCPIMLGSTPSKVVRHFSGGIGVEFRHPLSPDRFSEHIIL
jgi:hypothetical protein